MSTSVRTRLTTFRRKFRVTVPEMSALLGMTAREYRSLERGLTRTLPVSALPILLAGMRIRFAHRASAADSRARKNDERSKTRATARQPKPASRPSARDTL